MYECVQLGFKREEFIHVLHQKAEEVMEEFKRMYEEGKVDGMNATLMRVLNSAACEVFTASPLYTEERVTSAQLLGVLLQQRRRQRELLGRSTSDFVAQQMTDAIKQLSRQLRDTARKYWDDVCNRRVAELKQALEQRNYYLAH
eukprot:152377-Pyramimonas_sp.AAC.1